MIRLVRDALEIRQNLKLAHFPEKKSYGGAGIEAYFKKLPESTSKKVSSEDTMSLK